MRLDGMHPNKEIRENYLRALEFRYPEWIPCSVGFSPATVKKYREKLRGLINNHPLIFGRQENQDADFDAMPPAYRKGEYYTDNWGCTWYNLQEGIEGQVVKHPLEDWSALEGYKPPDISKSERGERDWRKIEEWTGRRRGAGLVTVGDGERLFDRLYFLRGFKNLMLDIEKGAPQLRRLIKMLEDHEMELVKRWLEIGVDVMSFHTDIGTQHGLMVSPGKFREYVKPMFKKLFSTCREADTHVYLSSDGRLLEIVEDLLECGVSVHDPQLRANTLDGIAKAYKGKMCVDLDLDRQMFQFCKPGDIRRQVKEAVEKLGLPEGGLMVKAEVYGADVPLENVEAICKAMEEFCIGRR